jgi:hypothetical protein
MRRAFVRLASAASPGVGLARHAAGGAAVLTAAAGVTWSTVSAAAPVKPVEPFADVFPPMLPVPGFVNMQLAVRPRPVLLGKVVRARSTIIAVHHIGEPLRRVLVLNNGLP